MKNYIDNIENQTLDNTNFRKVLFTGEHSQLVVMSLEPSENIGMEVHPDVDQFIRIEEGKGKAILDGEEYALEDDFAVVITAGTEHDIVNVSDKEPLKLYTIYSPPNHPDGTVHKDKAEADAYEESHHH
ncbi:cupin domain-containing protein [candidate division WWE3 bacterium]|nr:cupin domain-containing protein [candidate division WWE3 bacterium]